MSKIVFSLVPSYFLSLTGVSVFGRAFMAAKWWRITDSNR